MDIDFGNYKAESMNFKLYNCVVTFLWASEYLLAYFFNLIFILYWSIVDLQCRVSFQVYSKVIQLYMYIYPFFYTFVLHIGYYRILSRVPYAMQ